MLRKYSTHCATRHWPLGVFCNILDMAVISAWVIYKLALGEKIRKAFILQLIESLGESYVRKRSLPASAEVPSTSSSVPKIRHKCQATCKDCGIGNNIVAKQFKIVERSRL